MDGPRYILGNKIASGGMAEIHLGKLVGKDGFERICAIKRILPHLSSNRDFIEMFKDEAHICKKLRHTNIVSIEGFEDIDGSYAIIMEFVDGSDLRSILYACERSKTRLTVPMTLFIVAEAARGLHYAHTKRDEASQALLDIVHRDISPQNILISYEGEVKVTDFGIAKAKNKSTETLTGTVKGKYSYMSPEQISAQKVDRRSDIFSLGIVLWEMLAMCKLFQGNNDVSTIGRVRDCKIDKSLVKENKDVTPELEKLVLKCLAKDPKERYQTADDMEKAIRKFLYTNYADFSAGELGKLLKEKLTSKRRQMRKYMKTMLSRASTPASAEQGLRLVLPDKKKQPSPAPSPLPAVDGNAALKAKKPSPAVAEVPRRKKVAVITPSSNKKSSMVPLLKDLSASIKESSKKKSPPLVAYRTRRHKRRRYYNKNTQLNLLAVLSIIVLLVILAVILQNKPQQVVGRGDYLKLRLDTEPRRVKISVDNKPYKNGTYQETPLILKSTPGIHLVRIFREGYRPRKFRFHGKKGRTIDKTMVLEPNAKMSTVKIISDNRRKRYTVNVNNGFFVEKTPALVPDLIYNERHSVRIMPQGGGRMHQFTCSFVPTSRSKDYPYLLIIKGRRCTTRSR